MLQWQIFGVVAVIAMLLEMVMPSFFFLNFALAGIATAIISVWISTAPTLWIIFLILSLLSIVLFRPFCLKRFKNEEKSQTGVESTYYGKVAKVIEPVTKTSGIISIFDERWNARLADSQTDDIPEGQEVKIVGNDSLIMFVEKI
ncbi:MAG: NfeD family protein [Elusimicrobia bacterium]|nr:NfeD family protein [bacterium]MBQ3834464.1 NfeD family protein [Elusimicrobiota bacterium]